MSRTVVALLSLVCATASAAAQTFSADELQRRQVHRRGVEAVIWGMPTVNFDLMFQAMLKAGGEENQIV